MLDLRSHRQGDGPDLPVSLGGPFWPRQVVRLNREGFDQSDRLYVMRDSLCTCPTVAYAESRRAAKTARGRFHLTGSALNIDFIKINQAAGPSARVAVELSPDSARELVARIQTALRAAEEPASAVIGAAQLR